MSSYYQRLIREIDATVNPAGVEASMRLEHGTLNRLPRRTFVEETKVAAACEREQPGFLRRIAASYGMTDDFEEWEMK